MLYFLETFYQPRVIRNRQSPWGSTRKLLSIKIVSKRIICGFVLLWLIVAAHTLFSHPFSGNINFGLIKARNVSINGSKLDIQVPRGHRDGKGDGFVGRGCWLLGLADLLPGVLVPSSLTHILIAKSDLSYLDLFVRLKDTWLKYLICRLFQTMSFNWLWFLS